MTADVDDKSDREENDNDKPSDREIDRQIFVVGASPSGHPNLDIPDVNIEFRMSKTSPGIPSGVIQHVCDLNIEDFVLLLFLKGEGKSRRDFLKFLR